MAALNVKCFEKSCLCASCENVCSICLGAENSDETGVKQCDKKVLKPYEKFVTEYGNIKIGDKISEELYNNSCK